MYWMRPPPVRNLQGNELLASASALAWLSGATSVDCASRVIVAARVQSAPNKIEVFMGGTVSEEGGTNGVIVAVDGDYSRGVAEFGGANSPWSLRQLSMLGDMDSCSMLQQNRRKNNRVVLGFPVEETDPYAAARMQVLVGQASLRIATRGTARVCARGCHRSRYLAAHYADSL